MKGKGIAVTVVVAPLAVLMGIMVFAGGNANTSAEDGLTGVPAEYAQAIQKAGSICPEVTPQIIAAQIEAESNWNPRAVSPVGAQGLTQFMPGTWASHGKDGDGDGVADPFNPADAIASQGHYMCYLAGLLKGWGHTDKVLDLTLAAYNAGPGSVQRYNGVPPYGETIGYVAKIKANAIKYTATTGSGGSSELVATAKKYLGVPYEWGGTTANGLDCSGLIVRAYADMNKPLSVRTADQITRTYGRNHVDRDRLRPGDIISFRHKGTNHYHHIGIYAGADSNGQRLMLHAPTFGDVVSIVPLDTSYWQSMEWATFRI